MRGSIKIAWQFRIASDQPRQFLGVYRVHGAHWNVQSPRQRGYIRLVPRALELVVVSAKALTWSLVSRFLDRVASERPVAFRFLS
jgi:hypothetical protein